VIAVEFITATTSRKLVLPSGEAALLSGVKTTAKSPNPRTLVIVGARLADEAIGKGP
jgi:hypothetical protein